MRELLLPAHVAREIQKRKWAEQRAEQRAELDRLLDFDDPVCRQWQPELAKLDPHLRLARARPQAYSPQFSVLPGLYHWVRDNPTAPASVAAITGPDGRSFAEPDSRLLDDLRANDLQNPRVYGALLARHAIEEAEQERDLERDRQDRRQEILERAAAVTRTQVSLNPDAAWSQNVAGQRGARKR